MIRARPIPFLLAFSLLGAVACDDDDGTGTLTREELIVGSWTTTTFTYTAIGNPSLATPNLAPDAGVTGLTVAADHSFTGTAIIPGIGTVPLTGSIDFVNNTTIDVMFTGAASQAFEDFTAEIQTLNNNVLEFTTDDVTFDYSLLISGAPDDVPSILTVAMVRAS